MSKEEDKIQNSEHVNHVLHLEINGKNYEWTRQYILGAEVRKLDNISEDDEIFLSIKKPWEDELIQNDTKIDLARPDIEHFYSKKKSFILIINGREKNWSEKNITYEQVAKLAFDNYVENETTVYTVNYTDGPKQNPEGSMVKGDIVIVKNKMIFNVTATNRS